MMSILKAYVSFYSNSINVFLVVDCYVGNDNDELFAFGDDRDIFGQSGKKVENYTKYFKKKQLIYLYLKRRLLKKMFIFEQL